MQPAPKLSVLLPTLNSRALLPGHIESMKSWLDLAAEVIVVDSHSTDGTIEYIEEQLAEYPVKYYTRDRGLYQSWNFGIQQSSHAWLYISTVGDYITRELLQHLLTLGEMIEADVVLSCPKCVSDAGCEKPVIEWCIHELLQHAAPAEDFSMSGAAAHFYAWWHSRTSALLGSSASNLYCAEHMKKHPFPLEYGTGGDGAWGVMHGMRTRFGVTARGGSTFRHHVKSYKKEDYHVDDLPGLLFSLGKRVHEDLKPEERQMCSRLHIFDTIEIRDLFSTQYEEVKQLRKKHPYWYFYPYIWRKRQQCKRTKQLFDRLLLETHSQIKSEHLKPVQLPNSVRPPTISGAAG